MRRLELVTDCAACAGVCCIATAFDRGGDFAHSKPAGEGCRYLTSNARCSIHAERERRGYGGCAVYDCNGAGPRVTAALPEPRQLDQRSAAFLLVRQLHELLLLLDLALGLVDAGHPLWARLVRQYDSVDEWALVAIQEPSSVDIGRVVVATHELLREVGSSLGDRELARRRLQLLPQRAGDS